MSKSDLGINLLVLKGKKKNIYRYSEQNQFYYTFTL